MGRFPFQSPNHRGVDCNGTEYDVYLDAPAIFQSPNHRGVDCNVATVRLAQHEQVAFQSPNHRGVDCNIMAGLIFEATGYLSVP